MDKQERIYVDGFYTNDLHPSAPDFVLGRGSFNVEKLINWLKEHEQYAVNGYLNFQVLKSKKDGKRYTVLDLYAYNNAQGGAKEQPRTTSAPQFSQGKPFTGDPVPADIPDEAPAQGEDFSVEDIPF